jgi:hypothetical protein
MWLPSLRTTVAVGLAAIIGAGVLLARAGSSDHGAVNHDVVGLKEAPRADAAPASTAVAPPPASSPTAMLTSTYERVRRAVSHRVHRLVTNERAHAPRAVSKPGTSNRTGGDHGVATPMSSRCWALENNDKLLRLHVYRGMTLSDLAVHFDTTVDTLRRANPTLNGSTLLAGNAYLIPIDHLQMIRHVVKRGETMGGLGRTVDAPTAYSIRTWNCMDTNRVRAGDTVVLFKHPHSAPTASSGR